MISYDENFEEFLKEFAPRKPQALPLRVDESWLWSRRLAAVAILAVTVGGAVWFAAHSHRALNNADWVIEQKETVPKQVRRRISAVELTKLAIEDPGKLDAVLAEESRQRSAGLRGRESMLRVLKKE